MQLFPTLHEFFSEIFQASFFFVVGIHLEHGDVEIDDEGENDKYQVDVAEHVLNIFWLGGVSQQKLNKECQIDHGIIENAKLVA